MNSIPSPVGSIVGTNIVIADSIVEIDGVNEGSVPATETVEIDLINQDATPITPTSVTKTGNTFEIEITEPRILRNKFNVLTSDTSITYTITADEAGTITSVNNGGLTSVVIEVNSVPVSVH